MIRYNNKLTTLANNCLCLCLTSRGGSSPIFVRGCATWGSRTPAFDKARQRQNFDPVLRQISEKVSKKCLKMYDSLDFLKILRLKLAKHSFFRGETSIFSKKGPFCKALLAPKRDPFVRQNFKFGLWQSTGGK